MSKKANPAVIGAFVLGAALLGVVAILTLGAGKLFEKTETYVMFFEGDLGGLDVGAPVQYRGMRIGSVKSMQLELNTDTGDSQIPVYIQIENSRLTLTGKVRKGMGMGMAYQIDQKGIRGQLQTDSLITGKKKVSLIDDPGSPKRLVGVDLSVLEIPTVPTLQETLLKKLEDLPFQNIVSNLNATLLSVASLAGSPEVKEAVVSISQSSGKLESLLAKLEETVPALVKSTTATAEETRGLLLGIRPAMTNLEPLMVTAQANLEALHEVEKELTATLSEARKMMSEQSPIRYDLNVALERVGGAADSIRQFMDYLQRHPEAFLAGKGKMNNDRSNP